MDVIYTEVEMAFWCLNYYDYIRSHVCMPRTVCVSVCLSVFRILVELSRCDLG